MDVGYIVLANVHMLQKLYILILQLMRHVYCPIPPERGMSP